MLYRFAVSQALASSLGFVSLLEQTPISQPHSLSTLPLSTVFVRSFSPLASSPPWSGSQAWCGPNAPLSCFSQGPLQTVSLGKRVTVGPRWREVIRGGTLTTFSLSESSSLISGSI